MTDRSRHTGKRQARPAEPRPAPRLYLVTPPLADAGAFAATLAAALETADIAAVLLRCTAADERTLAAIVKTLAPVVQDKGVALLTDDQPRLAMRAGADGANIAGVAALAEAIKTLKPDRIAGCAGLATRHDAMVAAETGADYVMFGEPTANGRPPFPAVRDRVTWWAELFEPPCVGYAADTDEVRALAEAGADFVAVDFVWTDPRGIGAALAAVSAALALPEPVS